MSAPKFKISILGVLNGFSDTKVRNTLARKLRMSPEQVDAFLQNEGSVSKKLMPHQDAFSLQTVLRELGVDCVIRPMPLDGLAERAGTLKLNADAKPKAVSRTPVVRSQRPSSVRTGRSSIKPVASTKGSVSVWPVAAVVVMVVLASWLFNSSPTSLESSHGPQMASMLDRPID